MVRMGKRGQFYLIAAILLSAVIIGVAAISNSISTTGNTDLGGLKQQIQVEGSKTVDYAINNGLSQAQTDSLLSGLGQDYMDANPDKDFYFVYGSDSSIIINGTQASDKTVALDGHTITSSSGPFSSTITPSGSSILLSIGSDSYSIGLKSGENLYFVIIKETSGEKYVVTG